MRDGRIRNPLERTLMAAAGLLGMAVVLWLLAIAASWLSLSECSAGGNQLIGLDKGITPWPPGADCYDRRLVEGGGARIVNHEAILWLKWVILGLGVTAWATLLAGLFASIATLRSRPAGS